MDIKEINTHDCRQPVKIGVTGGVGSGKSIVCKRLRELGVVTCSADKLAREAVEPGTRAYERIVEHFGKNILTPDGAIDRPELRRIIIRDDGARKTLESFIHPEVLERMTFYFRQAQRQGAPMAAVEVPLLFETGMQEFFDYVIIVAGKLENRLTRIMERDNVSRPEAEALMKTQMPESEKRRLSDFVIDNNAGISEVHDEVDRIYAKLKAACKKTD